MGCVQVEWVQEERQWECNCAARSATALECQRYRLRRHSSPADHPGVQNAKPMAVSVQYTMHHFGSTHLGNQF